MQKKIVVGEEWDACQIIWYIYTSLKFGKAIFVFFEKIYLNKLHRGIKIGIISIDFSQNHAHEGAFNLFI